MKAGPFSSLELKVTLIAVPDGRVAEALRELQQNAIQRHGCQVSSPKAMILTFGNKDSDYRDKTTCGFRLLQTRIYMIAALVLEFY